jgi:hypothetical protein
VQLLTEVEVGVDVEDVVGAESVEGFDDDRGNRVEPADDERHAACLGQRPQLGDTGRPDRVGVTHVRFYVAAVGDRRYAVLEHRAPEVEVVVRPVQRIGHLVGDGTDRVGGALTGGEVGRLVGRTIGDPDEGVGSLDQRGVGHRRDIEE